MRSRIVLDTRVSPDDRVHLVVRYSKNGRYRRIFLLTAHRGEGRFTQPTSATQASPRELVFMPTKQSSSRMYAEAEQRHANRLAAIQRHFGQQITSRGNPDATHALAFVTEVDPARLWAPIAQRVIAGLKAAAVDMSVVDPEIRWHGTFRRLPLR